MLPRESHVMAAVAAVVLAAGTAAQSYRDLTLVRSLPTPYNEVLQLRAGLLGGLADDEVPAIGLENEFGWDGHVWYHQQGFTGQEASIDVYAGRDGAYASLVEGDLVASGSQSRLELGARYFPFYREGFYRNGDFVPTGQYEAEDFFVNLGLARQVEGGLTVEVAAFYRRNNFSRNDQTQASFVIPEDYNAYGGRVTLEQAAISFDQNTNRPDQGFVVTLAAEREQNDAEGTFGTVGIFESSLPSGFWRGLGRAEFYAPQSGLGVWEVFVEGQWTDNTDRVFNADAQKPIGEVWVDGTVGFRFELGDALWLTPFGQGQYVRIRNETGTAVDSEFFWGGGARAGFDLGSGFSILGFYSYLTNQSRAPVSTSRDTFGEHRFFAGAELRFGGS